MNVKPTKIFAIILSYVLLMVAEGCYTGCPSPQFPYFEYKALHIETPLIVTDVSKLYFIISFDSIEYVTKKEDSNFESLFINSVYAYDCLPDGGNGGKVKYDIAQINIYPDSVFTDSFAIGESISSLFRIPTWRNSSTGEYHTERLDSLSNITTNVLSYKEQELSFSSYSKPVVYNRPYYFDIEIIKENGDVLKARSEPITWKH